MRPRSLKFYRETMERVTRFEPLKDATLDSINRATVDAYIAFRLRAKSGKSPDAINGELRTIRRVLRYAEENGVIQKCPAIHCLETKGRERTITPAEETAYLGKATGDLRDAFTLLLDTGLRPDSELFPLRWENVGEKAIRVVASKTDSGVRQVPLTPRAQAILSMRRSGKPGLTPFVFPSTGETGHLATLKKRHYKACKDAEVARFPLYLLRHTFASRLAAAGVNRYILAALMGHSSPAIADRYYAHVDQQSVLSGFQQYLDSQPKPEPATLTLAPQAPQPQPQPTIQ
jgi:integrase